MKKIKNIYRFLLLLTIPYLLHGCKQEPQDLLHGKEDVYSGIYMPQAVSNPAVYKFNISSLPDQMLYGASYGGPIDLKEDIPVEFAVNESLVANYNAEHFTNYPILPVGSYELEALKSTINAEKLQTSPLKLKVQTDKLDGVGGYLLPVTVSTSSTKYKVKGNLSTTYFLVSGNYVSNPFPNLNRSAWTVLNFSSDENENASGGRVAHALDGDINTFWSTEWRVNKPGPPHHITIDMHAVKKIHGVKIAGRLANGEPRTTGNPRDIIVQTSNDAVNWTYSQLFSLENLAESTIYLDYAQEARYFKIIINSSHSDNYLTHIAELNAF